MPFKNFSYSTVATVPVPQASGTSLSVAAGTGTLFPTTPFYAVVWPSGTQPISTNAEVVQVTAIVGDTFTIVRQAESSSARTVLAGDNIMQALTVQTMLDLLSPYALLGSANTFTATNLFTGVAPIQLASTATGGIQIYNTVDQVTSFQRLEILYGANVAQIGTRVGNPAGNTPLNLFVQFDNNSTNYSRLDIQNAGGVNRLRQGLYTSATGTTLASISSASTFISFGNLTSASTSGSNIIFSLNPTYNQSASTAANTDATINRTPTSLGTGLQSLLDLQVGSTSWYWFGTGNQATTGAFNSSSAIESAVTFAPNFGSQTGTAGWDAFKLNVSAGSGSGAKNLQNLQVGGTTQFSVSNQGGISVKVNTNGRAGTFTLVGGTVTVANTSVTANTVCEFTIKTPGGTLGAAPQVVSTVVGTSFTVTGAGTNTSTYNYILKEIIP